MKQRHHAVTTAATLAAVLGGTMVLAGCGAGSVGSARNGPGGTKKGTSFDAAVTPTVVARASASPVDPAIVVADNAFGLSLWNTLLPGGEGDNIAISPLSVALALQVLYSGAAGSTPVRGIEQILERRPAFSDHDQLE